MQTMRFCPWIKWLLFFSLLGACGQRTPAYLDPTKPLEARLDDLISRMTFDEKVAQLFHNADSNERLSIPAFGGWNQGLHGVVATEPTTVFPVPIALASTWDEALVQAVANVISDEARALYNTGGTGPFGKLGLIYRAPVINISRDPRWGRIQETYGEDPYLTGKMGVAFIRGMQGSDPKYLKVASTLKHFAVNNQETGRLSLSATVSEKMLMEYYFPHFKMCVMEGHAQSVMAAYNAINGVPCAVNSWLLTDVLRNQWGFEGFVVSDLGGIGFLTLAHRAFETNQEAVAAAVSAGCDVDDREYLSGLPLAIQQGLLTERQLDTAVARYLRVAFRLGVFDDPKSVPYSNLSSGHIHSLANRRLAREAASASIVLLSNHNALLPIDRAQLQSVAVIGPMAQRFESGGYSGIAEAPVTPYQGIVNGLLPATRVDHSKGCQTIATCDATLVAEAAQVASHADVAILFVGTDGSVESEGLDRSELGLPGDQEQLVEAVVQANPKTVVVLMNGGPLAVTWAKDHAAAVVEAFYAGEEGGNAIAAVLFGDVNPSGKLPYTVYASTDVVPAQSEYDISKGFTYMYFRGEPVFPFGHGLSYTNFTYEGGVISTPHSVANGQVLACIQVRNTGARAGAEVVQLYGRRTSSSSGPEPNQKLLGFKKLSLLPNEGKVACFGVTGQQLASYDQDKHQFVVQPGTFELRFGASSQDIRESIPFEVMEQEPM